MRWKVCTYYPWLTAEFFELEGYLGWGPGHREYDGEGYPNPTQDAPDRLQWFLDRLGPPSDMLADLLTEAKGGAKAGKPSALLLRPGALIFPPR